MWTSREHSDIWKIYLLAIAEQAGLTDASLKPSESYAKTPLRNFLQQNETLSAKDQTFTTFLFFS